MYFSLDIIVTIVYNVSKSREEIQRNERDNGAKLYYDCKKEDWFCKNPGGSLIKKILWTVADKLEVL